ncbi:esterase/lipase family protein [Yinghuangia seranimata]|uniref:esterase/lipase family protein n=1 Tax=Yinghuangia seranimata TaxID=408067 RepID=UPI00248B414C|nr:alpha/beta fold hydrolase [Yinghuangia seranimata]MDI2130625.1 alpha/beta fold hydrolase [Yinghuangia seranimata]
MPDLIRNPRRPRKALRACVALLALCLAWTLPGTAGAQPAASHNYPVPYSFSAGIAAQLLHPGSDPVGANDFGCEPTSAHPYPVVLVHGTFGNMTDSWQGLSPLLANNGYCVFALNYGGSPGNLFQGYGDIPTSAAQLGAFVDRVLAATGAPKVDIVGHSQGGMMPRYFIQNLGGQDKVHELVGLSPSNHGTDFWGLLGLLKAFPGGTDFLTSLCVACTQQATGSDFLTALNANGDTVPGVHYTVIQTRYDEVVTPYTNAWMHGPGTTNVLLQNGCWTDFADHLAVIYDRVALREVLNALDPAHATHTCALVLPVLGG